MIALMDALKIDKAILGGFDWDRGRWKFDDATYDRTAAAFMNADHVPREAPRAFADAIVAVDPF
jgi:hypothetical protein